MKPSVKQRELENWSTRIIEYEIWLTNDYDGQDDRQSTLYGYMPHSFLFLYQVNFSLYLCVLFFATNINNAW